jgi:hypothetical protein
MKRTTKSILSLALIFSLSIPVTSHAAAVTEINNQNDLISHLQDKYEDINLKEVESVPENVTPKKFDTWEEAYLWIDQIEQEYAANEKNDSLMTINSVSTVDLHDGFVSTGQEGSVSFTNMPTSTGSTNIYTTYAIPGLSGQTIQVKHFVSYSNKAMTSSSRNLDVSGIGIANVTTRYSAQEQYGIPQFGINYYSVWVGDCGYFVDVAGVTLGFTKSIELTACLVNHVYSGSGV